MIAYVLRKQRNATIVGYQNGGSIKTSCFAALGTYQLPITKIRVRIPETCYDREIGRKAKGGRLEPDIVVDPFEAPTAKLLPRIVDRAVEHVLATAKK